MYSPFTVTALYFSRLLVFSHKKFGLRRKPLISLDHYKENQNFLSISKFLREIKLTGTTLNGSVGPTSHGKCRALLD